MIILLSNTANVIIVLLLIVLLFTVLHLKYNRKGEMTIVERFGKFHRLVDKPAIFFLFPFIDRVLDRLSTGEIVVARRFVYTKDHETIKVNITMRYSVFDPKLYEYASIDAIGSIIDLIKTAMENDMSNIDMDEQIKSYGRDLGLTVINYHID